MLILLLEILKGVYFRGDLEGQWYWIFPTRTNLDESAHTYVERSDRKLAYDVEGTVV